MTNQYRIYQNDNLIAVTQQKQYRVTQLKPSTNYQFSVEAFNERASGKKVTISLKTRVQTYFSVFIPHYLGGNPKVKVEYFAFGMGSNPISSNDYINVDVTVMYLDNNDCMVNVPSEYNIDSNLEKIQGCWYLSDKNRTLKFILTI